MNPEEQLQQMLRRQAAQVEQEPRALGFDVVRKRARSVRRRRRATVTTLAIASVVAIAVPTSLALRDDGHVAVVPTGPSPSGRPAPTHTPSPYPTATKAPSPTKTPTETPGPSRTQGSSPALDALASIPRGARTFLSYVDADGVVHGNGSTTHLPGTMSPSTQFTSYRGGWLVVGADNRLREYDGTGTVVASGSFGGMTMTVDRTRAAWVMGGRLYQGGLSTMGEATRSKGVPVPASAALIGYVPQGPALLGTGNSIRVATGTGSLKTVPVMLFPTSTSQATGLVGGTIGTPAQGNVEGAVYDLKAHTRLWHNGWMPLRFSDDGTVVAACPAGENGDPSAIAILDARTGEVIARTPKLKGLYLSRQVAWDQHRLVIPAVGAGATQAALLALDTSGKLTRVSDVEKSTKPGGAYLIFSAQP